MVPDDEYQLVMLDDRGCCFSVIETDHFISRTV
jgi:hypothetical protein